MFVYSTFTFYSPFVPHLTIITAKHGTPLWEISNCALFRGVPVVGGQSQVSSISMVSFIQRCFSEVYSVYWDVYIYYTLPNIQSKALQKTALGEV